MKLFYLFTFLSINCFSQTDSLEYYSNLFKDTGGVCNGVRLKSFNYLIKFVEKDKTSVKWLKDNLGVDSKYKRKNITEYEYAIYCPCEIRDENVDWTKCVFYRIIVRKRKIIKISKFSAGG